MIQKSNNKKRTRPQSAIKAQLSKARLIESEHGNKSVLDIQDSDYTSQFQFSNSMANPMKYHLLTEGSEQRQLILGYDSMQEQGRQATVAFKQTQTEQETVKQVSKEERAVQTESTQERGDAILELEVRLATRDRTIQKMNAEHASKIQTLEAKISSQQQEIQELKVAQERKAAGHGIGNKDYKLDRQREDWQVLEKELRDKIEDLTQKLGSAGNSASQNMNTLKEDNIGQNIENNKPVKLSLLKIDASKYIGTQAEKFLLEEEKNQENRPTSQSQIKEQKHDSKLLASLEELMKNDPEINELALACKSPKQQTSPAFAPDNKKEKNVEAIPSDKAVIALNSDFSDKRGIMFNIPQSQSMFDSQTTNLSLSKNESQHADIGTLGSKQALHKTKSDLIKRIKELEKYKTFYEKSHKQQSISKKKGRLDIGFLHASPLIFHDGHLNTSPQLQFMQEAKTIKAAVIETGQNIRYRSMVATVDNLSEMLQLQPQVLHISCHGIQTIQGTKLTYNDEDLCLLLENQYGSGELVNYVQLNKLITRKMPYLEVVFVAACQSEFVGAIFKKCGASHVVCVKKTEHVLDEVAIQFTKSFYQLLFDAKEVCEAFRIAKEDVEDKFSKTEADLFTLMMDPDHLCVPFDRRPEGKFECLNIHPPVKHIRNKLLDVQFREKQITDLVEAVLNESKPRLVTLLGHSGVGKSAIARSACHYILERRYFRGGVILIDMSSIKTHQILESEIKKVITKNLAQPNDDGVNQKIRKTKDQAFTELLVEFFDQTNDEVILKRKDSKSQKQLQFLLCLDNAQLVINDRQEVKKFRKFLQELLEKCKSIRIIITSSKPIMHLTGAAEPHIQFLKALKPNDSVELFIKKQGGSFNPQDLCELILEDQNFPIDKLDDSFGKKLQHPVSEEIKTKITLSLSQSYIRQKRALEKHDLFRQLSGNPMSINLVAQLNANTMLRHNDLKSIYIKVKKEINLLEDDDNSMKSQAGQIGIVGNAISLRSSTEASVQLLQETIPQSFKLFYLLGCLPDGINLEHLRSMWPHQEDISQGIAYFEELDFLNQKDEKVCLTTHLIEFAQDTVEESSKQEIMARICNFYLEFQQSLYQLNSAVDPAKYTTNLQKSSAESQLTTSLKPGTFSSIILSSESSLQLSKNKSIFSEQLAHIMQQNTLFEGENAQERRDHIYEVMTDMGNIQFCLDYYVKLAEQNKFARKSAIWNRQSETGQIRAGQLKKNLISSTAQEKDIKQKQMEAPSPPASDQSLESEEESHTSSEGQEKITEEHVSSINRDIVSSNSSLDKAMQRRHTVNLDQGDIDKLSQLIDESNSMSKEQKRLSALVMQKTESQRMTSSEQLQTPVPNQSANTDENSPTNTAALKKSELQLQNAIQIIKRRATIQPNAKLNIVKEHGSECDYEQSCSSSSKKSLLPSDEERASNSWQSRESKRGSEKSGSIQANKSQQNQGKEDFIYQKMSSNGLFLQQMTIWQHKERSERKGDLCDTQSQKIKLNNLQNSRVLQESDSNDSNSLKSDFQEVDDFVFSDNQQGIDQPIV